MKQSLFIPDQNSSLNGETVWRWYQNVTEEINLSFMFSKEKEYLVNYYKKAGLLRSWRKPFFRHHYSRTFAQALLFLLEPCRNSRILDLGCGTGTQSLLFALLGADVVGVDLDEEALNILNKRKAFYEDRSGRKLKLRMYKANSLELNYANISPIEGIYSMFAFNLMKPSRSLLEKIAPYTNNRCRLAILDGNNTSWLPRIFSSRQRPDCLSPLEFEDVLTYHSFDIVSHKAGFVLPPIFWLISPGNILRRIDGFLGGSWMLAISHQVLAEKNEREPS